MTGRRGEWWRLGSSHEGWPICDFVLGHLCDSGLDEGILGFLYVLVFFSFGVGIVAGIANDKIVY